MLPTVSEANQEFLNKDRFPDRFKNYLVAVHGIIRASVPLMKAAEFECSKIADRLCNLLSTYYSNHSMEEMHHDEWLLDDLGILGVSSRDVLGTKPPDAVAELVGAQYYWIHHLHPSSLLGYILVLEGYPITMKQIDDLVKKTGFPREAFRTLMEHSSLDVDHLRELDRTLDELPLSPNQEKWITLNAFYTMKKCSEIISSF